MLCAKLLEKGILPAGDTADDAPMAEMKAAEVAPLFVLSILKLVIIVHIVNYYCIASLYSSFFWGLNLIFS